MNGRKTPFRFGFECAACGERVLRASYRSACPTCAAPLRPAGAGGSRS